MLPRQTETFVEDALKGQVGIVQVSMKGETNLAGDLTEGIIAE